MEEQLQQSERNFRNSLDNSPVGIRIVDAEGELLYANKAILDIYGYSNIEELKSTPTIQRYTPESYAEHIERVKRRKRGEVVPSNYEISIVRKDGEIRHLAVFRKEVIWGGVTRFQTLYQDITERKQAEKLVLSLSKFPVENHNPVLRVTNEGEILFCNAAGFELLCTLKNNTNKTLSENWLKFARETYESGVSQTTEIEHERQTFLLNFVPIKDAIYLNIYGTNITERKRVEDALRNANRALRTIIECSKALINATDESELLSNVCQLIVEVGGYRMAWVGFAGQNKAKTVHPVAYAGYEEGYLDKIKITWADSEYGRVPISTAIRTSQPCIARLIPADPNFGPWRAEALKRGYNSSLALPLTFRHTFGALEVYKAEPDTFYTEEVEPLTQLARDLAYGIAALRTKMEHSRIRTKMVEYKELNKVKSALLSTVSHELRTPLATIKGYSTMLIDYDRRIRHAEKLRCLQSIDKATDRLTELVDRLLDMSRLDAGLLKLEKESTSIRRLVREAVVEARIRDPEHKILGVVETALPKVSVDPKRFRQILDNLINNSIKYSKKGTSIIVKAQSTKAELQIIVADEGIGIPAMDREKVFTRMYRAEQRLEGKGGLGLGLSLCKGLVEAHGGRIWMESNNRKGNRCVFTLPLS